MNIGVTNKWIVFVPDFFFFFFFDRRVEGEKRRGGRRKEEGGSTNKTMRLGAIFFFISPPFVSSKKINFLILFFPHIFMPCPPPSFLFDNSTISRPLVLSTLHFFADSKAHNSTG
jgi:hypothetical protein